MKSIESFVDLPARGPVGDQRLLVAHHLGAPLAVVEVVRDADHAGGADVVGRRRLDGARAAHAAQHLDGGDGSCGSRVHAVSEARGRLGG